MQISNVVFLLIFLVLLLSRPAFAQIQSVSADERIKVRELELQIESLKTIINENKENNNLLIENANRSIDYVNGLAQMLTVILSVFAIVGGYLAVMIRSKLSEIAMTNKELQRKIKYQKLLAEARFFSGTDQRYEAEQRAAVMRQLKPDGMHGYFFQAAYLKTTGAYGEAYNAMKIAGEKLGGHSVQIEFNLACYASLDNKPDVAFNHLGIISTINSNYLKEHRIDNDLDNIRQDPRFVAIEQL